MMTRALVTALLVACSALPAAAQNAKAPAKPDSSKMAGTKTPATKQAPGAKASDTKQAAPAGGMKAPDTKQAAPAPGTKAPDTKQAGQATGTKTPGVTVAPPPAATQLRTPTIMREVFGYAPEGRRDPFVSLLTSSDLRPMVQDLRLTSILYDENGPNSIAMMRDVTDNKQYRVTTGQTVGRMRVALIKRKAVIFSIEEFGMNRQDSLVLGDTTKARAK